MRIGLFGGTFDPPHLGHLIVAQDAYQALGLDRILFIPAAVPPHKQHRETTSPEVRLELIRAAIVGDSRFEASDVELRRSGPSYTIDTLHELEGLYPGAELVLLIGADQFREFHTWRAADEIVRHARLVVLSRGGTEAGPEIEVVHTHLRVTRIDISSTSVRRRVREGAPVRYLVPPAVERLVDERGLYRDEAPSARG